MSETYSFPVEMLLDDIGLFFQCETSDKDSYRSGEMLQLKQVHNVSNIEVETDDNAANKRIDASNKTIDTYAGRNADKVQFGAKRNERVFDQYMIHDTSSIAQLNIIHDTSSGISDHQFAMGQTAIGTEDITLGNPHKISNMDIDVDNDASSVAKCTQIQLCALPDLEKYSFKPKNIDINYAKNNSNTTNNGTKYKRTPPQKKRKNGVVYGSNSSIINVTKRNTRLLALEGKQTIGNKRKDPFDSPQPTKRRRSNRKVGGYLFYGKRKPSSQIKADLDQISYLLVVQTKEKEEQIDLLMSNLCDDQMRDFCQHLEQEVDERSDKRELSEILLSLLESK